MQWDISIDVCALVVLVVFCSYTFTMKRYRSKLNRLYDSLCIIVAISILFDIFGVVTVSYPEIFPPVVILAVNMIYLIIVNSLVVLLYSYVLVTTDSTHRGVVKQIIQCTPYIIEMLMILTTPWTRLIIYVDENGGYHRGSHLVFLHALGCIYVAFCIINMIRYKKRLSTHRRVAIYMFLVLLLGAIILQAIFSQLLLLGIACTLGAIAVYLGQYNPNETIDDMTDLFNKNSFYISVTSHIDEKASFSVITFELDDFASVIERYGEAKAQTVLKKVVDFLIELVSEQALFKLDGYRFAMVLGEKDKAVHEAACAKYYYANDVFSGGERMTETLEEKVVLQALMERFDHSWHIADTEILLSACISYITYPEDVKRVDEMNDMINASLKQARAIGTGTILYAAEYIKTRERYIDELQQKQIELREMTERAEEARIAAETADISKTRFLANMSHEIRTPMNAIMGMTELVLRDNINEQVRKNMSNIQSAGNTLLTVINDILDFSRIEAGKMEVLPGTYDVSSLLNNVISVSASRLVGKNLDFFVDVDPTLPSSFIGDEMRLRQIMINLLGNAIKYTDVGSVTLKLEWTLQEEEEETGALVAELKCSIIDTGSGIRKEDLNKLFQSFTRIEESKNRLVEGTGLGLSICKRLLDLMNGSIQVESVYGKGSTFSFTLPQEIVNIRSFTYVEDAENLNTLLYAEDPGIREGLTTVLAQIKVACTVVHSEKELQVVLSAQKFTHVFIEYSRYDQLRTKLTAIGKAKTILVLKSRQLMVNRVNTIVVQQPFYCLNVADALNDVFTNVEETKQQSFYHAPEVKILVVDDNAVNLQILSGLLQPHMMQIDTAESGKECLKLLQNNQYHMILMDHMMPDMDGIETLQAIRAMEGEYFKKVPIIAVTANAISGVKEMFEKAGFQDYISKPINIDRMEDTILKYIPLEMIKSGEAPEEAAPGAVVSMIIPGVNIHQGIEQCGGKLQNYLSLLSVVLLDGKKKLHLLDEYRESENYESYQIEAHAMKSVAASIGARTLSEIAKEQEFACREKRYQDVRDKHKKFYELYRMLLENIEVVLADNKYLFEQEQVKERGELNEALFCDRLRTILALLHDFEEDVAMRLIEEMDGYQLSQEQTAILEEIHGNMELFDYDEAEQFIQEQLKNEAEKKTESETGL